MAPRALPLFRRGLPWLGVALWSLGLSILAGMWLYLLHSLDSDRERAVAVAQNEVAGLNQAFAEYTRGSLQQLDQLARFVARDFERYGRQTDLSPFRSGGPFGHAAVAGVFLADARGAVFASTQGMLGTNVAQEDYFKVHFLGGAQPLYVGRPMPAGNGPRRVLHLTHRLVGPDGNFAGVAALVVDPAYFTGFYNEAQFGQRGLVNLVGLDGVVRARRSGDRLWFGDTITDNYPARQTQEMPQGGFFLVNRLDGVSRHMHYQVLRDYSVIAVTGLAEDEALAAYNALRIQRVEFVAAASVLLLLAFAGLGVLSHRLRMRAEALLQVQRALRESEDRLRMVADHIPGYVVHVDAQQRITYANRPYEATALVELGDPVGRTIQEARGPEVYEKLRPHVEAALAGEEQRFTVSEQREGQVFYLQYHYVPDRAQDGTVRGFYALGYDITALKQAELRQLASERRLRGVADNLPVLIAHLDRDERLEFANETTREWLGLAPDKLMGKTIAEIWGPELDAERRPYLERAYRGERVDFQAGREAMGVMRYLLNSYIPEIGPDGHVRGIYMLSTDVSALKEVEQRLSTLARFDTLTGLANRHQFNERLPEALARAQRSGQHLALMYLDIDHFKAINDGFGHAIGDGVLREFAVRLKNSVRATDTVARLAGDEFVVILENLHSDAEPQFVARKIVAQVNRPFLLEDLEISVSTSVGIALLREGCSAEELLARADKALYAAKSSGRNTFHMAASS